MEIQIQDLIEKIKSEGVQEAEKKSADIVKEAESKAAGIISSANDEAKQIIARAEADKTRLEQSGKQALEQAARDLILNLKNQITNLFDKVIKNQTKMSIDDSVLKETIVLLVKAWSEGKEGALDVLLPEDKLASLKSYFEAQLKTAMEKGVELKASSQIESGFKIAMKDGSAFYDFTDQGIAENLALYLNQQLASILMNIKGA
ncbi:MAG: V-type ATP synthase subunit E [Spirochaetales bacterium]|nr:V-type ATP synthase subunit E [Spirochaetales bacterium]